MMLLWILTYWNNFAVILILCFLFYFCACVVSCRVALCNCVVEHEERRNPVFITFPESQTVEEGAPVSFTCSLESDQPLEGKLVLARIWL